MGVGAMVGWGLVGLLVAAGVGLMFWLDWVLGAVFGVFVVLVLWLVFGVLKKKVDVRVGAAARRLGLEAKSHPFRYAAMTGRFKGLPVRVSYESARGFGLGSVLVADGAPPAWAALDAGNITLMRLEHGLGHQEKRLVDPGPPPVLVKGGELRLALPGVCTDAETLRQALQSLHGCRAALTEGAGG